MAPLSISVLSLSGRELVSLSLDDRALVQDLHLRVSAVNGVPPLRQHLLLDGVELSLKATLAESGVKDGARVALVVDAPAVPGDWVLVATNDDSVRLWSPSEGRVARTIRGHDDEVRSARLSPDGALVATASRDCNAAVWCAETGARLLLLGHGAAVTSASFSPDAGELVTASEDCCAKLWDVATGAFILTLQGISARDVEPQGHTGPVRSAVFSPDGSAVLTASADCTAKLWSAESSDLIATLRGHAGAVNCAVFTADGSLILTASDDCTAKVWDRGSERCVLTFEGHRGPVLSAAVSSGGELVLTASADCTARLWRNDAARECIRTLEGHGAAVCAAAFSRDGSTLLTGCADGVARLWPAEGDGAPQELDGGGGPVFAASFVP